MTTKKSLLLFLLTLVFAASAAAQAGGSKAGGASFPGVSKAQMDQLLAAKKVTAIALPTWLPTGFKVEKVHSKLGRGVAIHEREFIVVYSRKLENGKTQRFALEAGFDGLGDLMYDGAKTITSSLGKIHLYYEPKDPDTDGQKLKNYVMTEWFNAGKTAFHYIGFYGSEEKDDPDMAMISLADTEKILRSLKRL